jgi:hypothetical protein
MSLTKLLMEKSYSYKRLRLLAYFYLLDFIAYYLLILIFFKVDIDTPKMRGLLEAYIKDCQPLIIEDILTTVNDVIYKLGFREAVRFVSEREVGVSVSLTRFS